MNKLVLKLLLRTGKMHFFFVFFIIFLSLIFYSLGSNIVVSVQDHFRGQLKPILGGDIVIESKTPVDQKEIQKYSQSFEIGESIETLSTIFDTEKQPSLFQLMYTTQNFPFYYDFTIDQIERTGKILIDTETYLKYGNTLTIYDKNYQVLGVITQNLLNSLSAFNNQSIIYLPIEEFPEDLSINNSRLEYKYYFKLKPGFGETLIKELQNDPAFTDLRKNTLENSQNRLGNIFSRLEIFLSVFNILIFVFTFFISILFLEGYVKKMKPTFGLLLTFGMSIKKVLIYNVSILLVGVLGGYVLSSVIVIGILDIISTQYEFIGISGVSFIKAFFAAIIVLIVGISLPFYKLFQSNVGGILKEKSSLISFNRTDSIWYIILLFFGFLSISLLSGVHLVAAIGYALLFIVFLVATFFFIRYILDFIFQRYGKKIKDFYVFDAIRSTVKPGNVSFLMVYATIISFFSIFVFFVFSGSFVNYLNNISNSSADTFVINAQSQDFEKLQQYFTYEEIYEIVPMRIVEINGQTLGDFLGEERPSRQFSREFFSTTKRLATPVVEGKILTSGYVSVDAEFAGELGVQIGDEMVFSIAGLQKKLQIVNLREASRSGTDPFFYFQLHEDDFIQFPKSYIVAYKSQDKDENLTYELSQNIGSHLSFIQTAEFVKIVQGIINQILGVINFALFYIFLFALLAFIASMSFLKTFKNYKNRTLHILGGAKEKLRFSVQIEYVYLVTLGFFLSLIFGSLSLLVLFQFIEFFEFNSYIYGQGIILLVILLLIFVGVIFGRKIFGRK